MMKKILMALLAAGCIMAGTITAGAANRLNLQGIGTMDVPQNITFEKGPQNALPFMAEGGTKRFFIRNGMTKSDYYTMTWKKGLTSPMAGPCPRKREYLSFWKSGKSDIKMTNLWTRWMSLQTG